MYWKKIKSFWLSRIGIKIVLASLLVSVMVVVNTYFIIARNLKEQKNSYTEVYNSILYLSKAFEMMESFDHQRMFVEQYVYEGGDQTKKDRYIKEKKLFNKIFKNYYNHSCNDIKPLLIKTKDKLNEYNHLLEEIIFLYDKNVDYDLIKEKFIEIDKVEADIHNNYLHKIILHIKHNHIEPAENNILTITQKTIEDILISNIFIILLSVLLGFLVSYSITRPIYALLGAIRNVSRGNFDFKINIRSHDEIGELSFAFIDMAKKLKTANDKIKEYNQNLRKEIHIKTQKLANALEALKKDKKELEEQKLATLNILEDVSESQKKLQILNNKLKRREFELESLKLLNEELTTVFSIEELLDVVSKYLHQIAKNSVCFFAIRDKLRDEIFVKAYLFQPISEKVFKEIYDEFFVYLKKKKIFSKMSKDNIQLVLNGQIDNQSQQYPKASFILPFKVSNNFLGAVHVSFLNLKKARFEYQDLIKAIVASASIALDKLQTLILAQHSRTESLINSLLNGVIMFDKDSKIVFVNPAASSFLGLKTIPKNLDGLLEILPIKNLKKIIQDVQKKGKLIFLDDCQIQNRYYELYIVPVKDYGRKNVGVAFIIHDITQRKQIEKMKSEFVSITSHQLRTPLTAIKLFSDMLVNGNIGNLTKKQKEYVNNIRQSTERMIKLVNDLLNISRIESGRIAINPQPVDLIELIESVIESIRPLSNNKRVKIIFNKPKRKWPKINLDQNLIRQVVNNLIVNAVRYSYDGGKVEISLHKYLSKYILIKVKDYGIGISKKQQDKIFQKFFRTDAAVKHVADGSGLGLYVSKMIIEASGGKIWFKSKKNKGTTFYVMLPFSGMKPKKGDRNLIVN